MYQMLPLLDSALQPYSSAARQGCMIDPMLGNAFGKEQQQAPNTTSTTLEVTRRCNHSH